MRLHQEQGDCDREVTKMDPKRFPYVSIIT